MSDKILLRLRNPLKTYFYENRKYVSTKIYRMYQKEAEYLLKDKDTYGRPFFRIVNPLELEMAEERQKKIEEAKRAAEIEAMQIDELTSDDIDDDTEELFTEKLGEPVSEEGGIEV